MIQAENQITELSAALNRGDVDGAPPDAELINLGRLMDALIPQHQAARQRFLPLWGERERLMKVWLANHPGQRITHEDTLRISEEAGLLRAEREDVHPDDIIDQLDPVSNAIIAIPALTLAGLAVKARLAKFGARHYWDAGDDDVDWDQLVMRSAIDAVIHAAAAAS